MSIDSSRPSALNSDLHSALASTLPDAIHRLRDRLRPGQQRMADWAGGTLAVSAVPGSGKSTGMAIAAAILLARRYLHQRDGLETVPDSALQSSAPASNLILVTFTRSAAANLKLKIRQALAELSLAPQGFAVYTLHGLALTIASRYPELSGLSLDRMTLVTPTQSSRLLRTCVEQWISANPTLYFRLLEGAQFDGEETERLRRQSVLRTEVLPDLAYTVIHEAKSSGLTPADLRALGQPVRAIASPTADDYSVLTIAAGLYESYQALLSQRSFIDYDDMILAALRVLDDATARALFQSQVYAVFEDEAQDSSPLQTRLLELLAANTDQPDQPLNLVRVGDPNQAINSTFTPADPVFFRQFCQTCQVQGQLAEMDQAGRSTAAVMEVANAMLLWVNQRYGAIAPRSSPDTQALEAPFRPQRIQPVAASDPQPDANPVAIGAGVEIRYPPDIFREAEMLGQRVVELFSQEPQARAAVLVRENRQGRWLAETLRNPEVHGISIDWSQAEVTIYDVGERDRHSHIPAEMLALLQFIDRPHSPDNLKAALRVLVDRQRIPSQDLNLLTAQPEQFLYPGPLDPAQPDPVLQAQRYCTALLHARLELPQYQLIPFLAMTLGYEQSELATADKLAARIAQQTAFDPSMVAVLDALYELVRAEQFEPVETDDPEARYIRPGQLTIITMHKAKGLDWDFVFIPFLTESTIPGSLWVPPQAKFLGEFSLAEVARAQIRAHIHQEPLIPDVEQAWSRANYLKLAEEFRLLYVAITRAKRLLWMSAPRKAPFSWQKPENLDEKPPCPVLPVLSDRFPQTTQR